MLRIDTVGAILGETALFEDTELTTYVQTLSDMKTCCLKKEDFSQLLPEYPNISIQLLKERNRRLLGTEKQSLGIATESTAARIPHIYTIFPLRKTVPVFRFLSR